MAGITGMQTAGGGVVVPFSSDGARYNAGIDSMESKTRTLEDTLKRTGDTIGRVGMRALKLGTALAAPLALAAKEAIGFQKHFAEVNTLISDMPTEQFDKLKEGVKSLSMEIGENLTVATRALYQAISASVPSDNVLAFMKIAGMTAKAGVSDMFTAVDALTTVVNAYGSQLDKFGDYSERALHVSDVLFQTVVLGKTTFGELASSIGTVASTAASFKVSLEELGAMYVVLTKRGINTAEASTYIGRVIQGLEQPADDAKEAMDRLGIEYEKFQKNQITFPEIMQQIADKTHGAGLEIAKLFPEMRGFRGAVILAAEGGKEYSDALEGMVKSSGQTIKAFDIMEATVDAAIDKMKATFRVALVEIGDVLLPKLVEQVKYIKGLLDTFVAYGKASPDALSSIVIHVAELAAGLIAFGAASMVIGHVVKGLVGIVIAAKAVRVALVWAFSPAIFQPHILAIVAVSAALALVIKKAYETHTAMKQLADSNKSAAATADKFLDRLVREHQITEEQAKSIRSLATVKERFAATQQAVVEASRNKIATEIEMITGQIATEQQLADTRQAIVDKNVSTRTAAMYATKQITETELDNIAKVSSTEQQAYDERLRIFYEFHAQEATINSKSAAQQKALLDFLGVKTASEVQQQEIVNVARANSLDLATAAFVVQNNLTADQIAMVQQGAMAEVYATQAKDAARKQDVVNQEDALSETVVNWGKYLDLLDQAYTEMADREAVLQSAIKQQIAETGAAEKGTTSALIALHRTMRGMAEERLGVEAKVGNSVITRLLTEAGLAQETADATVSANEVTRQSNEALAASGLAVVQQLLATSDQYSLQYGKLTDEQATALNLAVGGLVTGLTNMDEITGQFPVLLKRVVELHPEVTETDAQRVVKAIQGAATNVDEATAPVHDQYNQRFALSHAESPSVLDILQNDIGIMSGIYETLTNVVGSATSTIYGMWQDLSNSLVGGIFQDIYNGMQYLNPWATHSPSLVSSVKTGVSAIEQSWLDSADKLYESYKATYAKQIALLSEYLAAGNTLNTMIATNAQGQIDYGESRIDQGPTGFSVSEYIAMLEALQRISNLLEQAVGINKQFPMVPLTPDQTAANASNGSGSLAIGDGTTLRYNIESEETTDQNQVDYADAAVTLAYALERQRAGKPVETPAHHKRPTLANWDWSNYGTTLSYNFGQRKRDSDVLRLLETGNLYDTTPESMALDALQSPRRRLQPLGDRKPRVKPERVTRTFAGGYGGGMAVVPSLLADPKWWHVTQAPPTGAAIDAVGGQLLSRVLASSKPPRSQDNYGVFEAAGVPASNNTMNMNIGQVRSDTQIRVLAQAAAAEAEMLAWRRRR